MGLVYGALIENFFFSSIISNFLWGWSKIAINNFHIPKIDVFKL